MKDKIIYKDLSYQIVGVLFDVFNELGPGHIEKIYEKAIAKELGLRGIKYKRQVSADLFYKGENVGKFFLDFLIENKIVLELKIGRRYAKKNFDQVTNYLKVTKKQLAILAMITQRGVNFTRVLNISKEIDRRDAEINFVKMRKLFNF